MQKCLCFGAALFGASLLAACGTSVPASRGCPQTTQYESQFCLTAAENQDHQVIVHDPTIPDRVLVLHGITLTRAPHDRSSITQNQAERAALQFITPPGGTTTLRAHSAIFAELHNSEGLPTDGQLVWLIDVSPPGGITLPQFTPLKPPQHVPYEWVLINATSGDPMYLSAGGAS